MECGGDVLGVRVVVAGHPCYGSCEVMETLRARGYTRVVGGAELHAAARHGSTSHAARHGSTSHATRHGSTSHTTCEGSTSHAAREGSTSHATCEGSTSHATCEGSTSHATCEGSTSHATCEGSTSHVACEGSTSHTTCEGSTSHATCEGSTSDAGPLPNTAYFLIDAPTYLEDAYRTPHPSESEPPGASARATWRNSLCYWRGKLLQYASLYQAYLVDGTKSVSEMADAIERCLRGDGSPLPDVSKLTQEEFLRMPLLIEGESKIVRECGPNLVCIQLKPTLYSFTHNRDGEIAGTDTLRRECSMLFLDVLRAHGIEHSYYAVGDRYILSRRVEHPPPIEVIVKAYHVGTPTRRYVGMDGSVVRPSHPVHAGRAIDSGGALPSAYVRFDWRNPKYHPQTRERLSDEPLSDEHADYYIDTDKAKELAHTAFRALSEFLIDRGIMLFDICFMIDESGRYMWGEVSQDCGRYKHVGSSESLDKDVFRSGAGESEVIEKFTRLLHLLKEKPLRVPWEAAPPCQHEDA